MRKRFAVWLMIAALIASGALYGPVPVPAAHASGGGNLAAGKPVSASSHADVYAPAHANDGNPDTYWESANHAFPQWFQIDLGQNATIDQIVLKLPAGWEERTQTIQVLGSTDGHSFAAIAGPTGYTFDPVANQNTVSVPADATARFVRLVVTANTGWPAAQFSEIEIHGEPVPGPVNLALGKPITSSGHIYDFEARLANDGDVLTYWEAAPNSYPNTLTVDLGAAADLESIVLRLNPDPIWGPRTQTLAVQVEDQDGSTFATIVPFATYAFDPATGNVVTIPVAATARNVRLVFSANSGAAGGQVAELEIMGTYAPNPDLTVTGLSWSPADPDESGDIVLQALVRNIGTAHSPATTVHFYLNNTFAGSATVGELAPGEAAGASLNIGTLGAGTYAVTAHVDERDDIPETDNANNRYTHPELLVVGQTPGADLTATASWTPGHPAAGQTVTFTVTLHNLGNMATSGGPHGITLVLKDAQGATVHAWSGSHSGAIAPGSSVVLQAGAWTAANGRYTVETTVTADAHEPEARRANNASSAGLYIGRGANMPFTVIEAEAPGNTTNGTVLAPNYQLGDLAGEASGRSAVRLDAVGEYVEFTLTSPANGFVLRHAVAENTSGTVSLYADGVYKGKFQVTSKYAYVYASPDDLGQLGYNNQPGPGRSAYWLYDDAQLLLDQVYPAGTKIKIQLDPGDVPWICVDMIETENVAPPASNPDPSRYVEVSATTSIEQALNEFRQDPTKKGIFIPAGEWPITNKIYLYGRATEIIGAGPWHTKLVAPQDQTNTDVGFNIGPSANGSVIKDLSAWGNYVHRVDGPGKFIDGNGMQHVTVENVWVEHFVCLYWGVNASHNTFRNNRIKNMFADGINMTNGSSYNVLDNNYARATGDDAFALFSAIDAGGTSNVGNLYTNLTAVLVRRAAAFAVYGGSGNLFQNLYAADTLTYPGITISSLSFNYHTLGFGDEDTVFDGITLERTGGDFWNSPGADDKINDRQNFAAIWFYSGDRTFKNIVVKNVDIRDPVYFGLMFQTMHPQKIPMQNVRLENINIYNPPRYGIKLVVKSEEGQGPPVGSASFTNVKVYNPGLAAIYGEAQSPEFQVIRVSGNNW